MIYDSSIHSINMSNKSTSKKRYKKRDKQTDKKRKSIIKEQHYTEQYNDLLLHNLLKEYYSTKSPHLIVSRKWFYKIRKNTIMLKSVREINIGKDRHVYYDIEQFGDNVRYIKKGNVFILNPSTTINNTIYIMVRLRDLSQIEKLQFHTELGHMITNYDVKHGIEKCYVILSIIKIDKLIQKTDPIIIDSDLPLMKRYFVNQIAIKKGNYHFNTTGTIYGLGYGPKSNRNKYGHSVCKYANHKLKFISCYFSNLTITYNPCFVFPDIEKKKFH